MSIKNITKSILGNLNTTMLFNQLKSSSQQYKILSKDEEQALINKYRDNRLELNRLLVLHNMRVVLNIAKKYANKTDDFDGMVLDGLLGLSEAANRFDIDAGIKFITYAHIWVKKYVLARFYAKNIDIEKNSISLNSITSNAKDDDSVEFEDYVNEFVDKSCTALPNIDKELSASELIEICNGLMKSLDADSSLSSTDKQVFTDIFYNREKTSDIASKYKLSREDILGIKHKILAKFKDILAEDYGIEKYEQVS